MATREDSGRRPRARAAAGTPAGGGAALPVPAWRGQRKGGGAQKQPLSQDLIVETALRILDAEGLDGVSMRRVAQELDTGPASLYAHVSNKEELLDVMFDRVCGEIRLPEPDPARWREQIKEVAYEIHRVMSEHADIARVPLGNIPTGVNSLRVNEWLLTVMLAGGVPSPAAVWGVERLYLYINADAYEGSLHLSKQRASGLTEREYMTRFLSQVREFFAALPVEQFPSTVGHIGPLLSPEASDGEDRFEFGLEIILRGLESYIER
ncbi:TetR/AcrR family transcriptional regulator [Actinomadura rupiterrae]|uniref:TetR/AcrR family transcriptional regulator n=1 Tax=Actinomadura rupiterrae TaxID=559627 RepID=UPI0020A2C4C1|nr:TetR/AcrR family transcriptional regulator [Actinomadura rupiterrae]MCP2340601.1 AcrR family transcriptional regulator [Actinomadura rupiterrae]